MTRILSHRRGRLAAASRALCAALLLMAVAGCGGSAGDAGDASVATFSKSYGGPLHDEASVVIGTDDGGFMLFGSAEGNDLFSANNLQPGLDTPHGGDFWVQKLDANGNVERNRLIGVRAAFAPGTVWQRARATADGGVLLTGRQDNTDTIQRPNGATAVVTVGSDIAVARLDAAGSVVWRVTHNSGAWLNYDYFAGAGLRAAARDGGIDVWPTADGGALVAARSLAHLEDRFGIGFPCADADLDALAYRPCENPAPNAGNRFMDAVSVVVLRLNGDGSVRWQRRLTDNAFDIDGNESLLAYPLGLLIRATDDGGAVLARPVEGGSLVHRLAADGAPLWRRPVGGVRRATGLVQTDDPVDGPDGDRQDGQRDDGFALAGNDRVAKLRADGSEQWNTNLAPARFFAPSWDVFVNDLVQHCDYGRPTRCDLIAVGSSNKADDQGREIPSGYAFFLDPDGDVRIEAFKTEGPADHAVRTLTRIAGGSGNTLQLLGVDPSGQLMRMDMEVQAPPSEPILRNLRTSTEKSLSVEDFGRRFPEFRADGSVLQLTESGLALKTLDTQIQLQSEQTLVSAMDSDVLRAAVQIAPGRFVIAGTRHGPGAQTGIVALRYDLDASGEQVVWQRRLEGDRGANVLAAAASGDGGVVLSLLVEVAGERNRVGLLVKLDGDGNRQWQSVLPGPADGLQRLPDGGFAALSASFDGGTVRVTRLSAAGARLWQNSVSLGTEAGAVEALTTTADGGLALVGSFGPRIGLLRLAPDGALASAVELLLPASVSQNVFFDNLRVRQAADGGFVLAMTERGLFTSVSDSGQTLPRGQSNVLVLKVDAAGALLWSRVYGARFDEGVRDLALGADGTIAIAGFSDSLGDRREAWLLKLSPHGLISSAGCQALLGSIAPGLIGSAARAATVAASSEARTPLVELPPLTDVSAPVQTPQDHNTARQCLGDASAGSPIGPIGTLRRLGVLQVGSQRGVVTSTPAAISCGTGLDVCSAEFADGERVTLLADPAGFNAWRADCDEGTGGTQLACVVVLGRDRTIQVDFGPPPPPLPPRLFTLAFAVQGNGFVRADGGINCGEGGLAASCSRDYAEGSLVNVSADASPGQVFLGWSGEAGDNVCAGFGRQTAIRITVDRNRRCFAQFGPPDGFAALTVQIVNGGAGRSVDSQPAGITCSSEPGRDCSEVYPAGTFVTLRATPAGFQSWQGCDEVVDVNFCRLTMTQPRSVIATFAP